MINPKDMQVFEILNEVSAVKSDALKIELLQTKYSDHTPLLRVLKMNFCDTIISTLPEGAPPLNREKIDGPSKASLWSYIKHFPIFVRSGASANMRPLQIERIFIEMLEAIDVEEADMFLLAKDKQLTNKWNISLEVVREAFPNLNITTQAPKRAKTVEERIAELTELAEFKKNEARRLNEEARKLLADAKALSKEVEENV